MLSHQTFKIDFVKVLLILFFGGSWTSLNEMTNTARIRKRKADDEGWEEEGEGFGNKDMMRSSE